MSTLLSSETKKKKRSSSGKIVWRVRLYIPEAIKNMVLHQAKSQDRKHGKILSTALEEYYGRNI